MLQEIVGKAKQKRADSCCHLVIVQSASFWSSMVRPMLGKKARKKTSLDSCRARMLVGKATSPGRLYSSSWRWQLRSA